MQGLFYDFIQFFIFYLFIALVLGGPKGLYIAVGLIPIFIYSYLATVLGNYL
jgi:hypothetical protein